ncbi:MAG: hypothetical protein JXA30_13255 [Deltaproteobacteria bacterium]|nr:hypothetical protein [Deltaproteobacteria bacterium]
MNKPLFIIEIAAALLIFGCSTGDNSEAGDMTHANGTPVATGGYATGPTAGMEGQAGRKDDAPGEMMDGGVQTLPPEKEKLVDFEQPQAGKRFVFVVNPETDSVFIIDSKNFAVKTAHPPGDKPTFLKTVESPTDEADIAIVLNAPLVAKDEENNAAVIRAKADEEPTANALRVVKNSNVIAVSPDGRHAVVYYNSNYSSASDSSGRYQDVTVISLSKESDQSFNITVGFRPSAVYFTSDGTKGFVVTEDGVSILDFAEIERSGAGVAETVSLGYTLSERPSDVSITADGRYALARLQNDAAVYLVDLETRSIKALNLVLKEIINRDSDADDDDAGVDPRVSQGQITDLDLAASGDYAVAVLRDTSEVLKIPVPQAFDDPSQINATKIDGVVIGLSELAPDGRHALLYTTVVPDERVTVLDLEGETKPQTVRLQKSIETVAIAPDSKNALLIHTKQEGWREDPAIDENTRIDRSYGYSILRLADGFPKLQVTDTQLGPFVITPEYLFILFRDDALSIKEVQRVSLVSLQVDTIGLKRPPYSIGSISQFERVFIAQEQAGGLITLMDWKGDLREDISGFDRNPKIERGSEK